MQAEGMRGTLRHGRVAARIADLAATTLRGITPRGRIPCRRRIAERVREHSAERMRMAEPRIRTAAEGARAWERRVAEVDGLHRAAAAAEVRPRLMEEAAAGVRPRIVEAENGVDVL